MRMLRLCTEDTTAGGPQLSDFTSTFTGKCLNFSRGIPIFPEGNPYGLGAPIENQTPRQGKLRRERRRAIFRFPLVDESLSAASSFISLAKFEFPNEKGMPESRCPGCAEETRASWQGCRKTTPLPAVRSGIGATRQKIQGFAYTGGVSKKRHCIRVHRTE